MTKVRQRFVIRQPNAGPSGMTRSDFASACFRCLGCRTQKNEGDVAIQKFVQHCDHQIKSLLNIDSRNHRKQRLIHRGFVQTEIAQQRPLVLALAFGSASSDRPLKCAGIRRIRLRIPDVIIDSIEDSNHGIRTIAQNAVQSE